MLPASIRSVDFQRLQKIICAGDVGALQSHLQSGLCSGLVSDQGLTLLHVAVNMGMEECVSVLLASGADVNAVSSSGRSALLVAATLGYDAILTMLLEHGTCDHFLTIRVV